MVHAAENTGRLQPGNAACVNPNTEAMSQVWLLALDFGVMFCNILIEDRVAVQRLHW